MPPRPRLFSPRVAAGLVLLSPVFVIGAVFVSHAASYEGTCGPYAPDISKFPCDYGTYIANFFSPFALMGMVVLSAMTMLSTGVLVGLALGAWKVVQALRRRSAQGP